MNRLVKFHFILALLLVVALPSFAERIMLPMADGTQLATDVYLPKEPGQYPVIFARTPYNIDGMKSTAEGFVKEGYVAVMQDTRGSHNSKGTYIAFNGDGWGEHQDGLVTLRWIRAQEWSNGKVTTLGASALGITQVRLAGAGDPLTCQFIQVAASKDYGQMSYQGGVLRKALIEGWLTAQQAPHMIEMTKQHPSYDSYWKEKNAEAQAAMISAPAMHIGGWFDIFGQGTINNFTTRQYGGGGNSKGNQKLIMGPWAHGISQKVGELTFPDNYTFKYTNLRNRFFDYWNKDGQNGVMEDAPVNYYTMGDVDDPEAPGNEWRTAQDWPPFPTEETAYYLLKDKGLSTEINSTKNSSVGYLYDPSDPVPTHGGANLLLPAGSFDQRKQDARDDVLTFMTPVLKEAVEVTGAIRLKLYVSSSAIDTDFTAKLLDVYPDGRQMLITDGIQRVKFRNGFEQADLLPPGAIGELDIDLWNTSLIYNKGHRIAVQISSSNYPRFEINPNTGDDFPDGVELVKAENTLHFGSQHPSALILPIPTKQ